MELSKITYNFSDYLKKLFPIINIYFLNGNYNIQLPFLKIKKFLFLLKNHTQCQYKILSDLCAVDYPWKKKRFEIIYNILSIKFNSRLSLFLWIEENYFVPSILLIHSCAGWFEREIWDLFGVYFTGNNDLRRILTDYGFKGHPLRKDFPLSGYIEVRYIGNEKRVLAEEIYLAQDYRTYFFNNNWNKII